MIAVIALGALVLGLLCVLVTILVREALAIRRAIAAVRRHRHRQAAARLTAGEATALAAAAIEDPFLRDALVARLDEQDGALVWRVASMTIDMGVTATVDDATGAVREVHPWSAWPRR